MKKLLILILLSYLTTSLHAQSKKVLLEEFTGTACGNCPMGVYYIDSMQAKYDGVIAVSLHAFPPFDAMHFSAIDSLFSFYAGGVPCGSIDRILWPGEKPVVARQLGSWDTIIRNRLLTDAQLTVSLTAAWNSLTRDVSVDVNINILSNMPSGDYRLNLYVLEDSITGSGSGYDQLNYYDKTAGNPFYGRGNPIIGYVHRHVARALLPSAWGLQGLIPASPLSGQYFKHTFNYTLPTKFQADRIRLIAYVYRFSSDHKTDEVLNAEEKKLISPPTEIAFHKSDQPSFKIYPNPTSGKIYFSVDQKISDYYIRISNTMGQEVLKKIVRPDIPIHELNIESLPKGIYSVQLICGNKISGNKLMVIN
jgi:hypothetical protein